MELVKTVNYLSQSARVAINQKSPNLDEETKLNLIVQEVSKELQKIDIPVKLHMTNNKIEFRFSPKDKNKVIAAAREFNSKMG